MANDMMQQNSSAHRPTVRDVQKFWQANPLAARANPYPLGTPKYFAHYDLLREANEPAEFSRWLHEYEGFSRARVMDVGCGNGYVLSRYAAAGAKAVGVDLTRAAVELSRRRFDLNALSGSFVQANAEALPFCDHSFDCVCSMGVLHHTPNTVAAIREIRRVLKPGGRLIVMFYHRDSFLYRIKFPVVRALTGRSIEQQINEVDGVGNPKGDVYSRRELSALLEGFDDLELFTGQLPWNRLGPVRRVLPQSMKVWFERRLGWFLYARGWKI